MVWRVSVTLTQLRSFLAVVRAGSVTAAADELVVTQPSVSAALAALARELDAPLFDRDGRGLRLTAAGEAFAPYAADVVGLLDQGAVAVREASAAAASVLRIAAVTTAAESFVPGLMHAFAAERPGTRLTLAVGNRDQVFAGLLGHASDVAFAGRPPEDDRLTDARLPPEPARADQRRRPIRWPAARPSRRARCASAAGCCESPARGPAPSTSASWRRPGSVSAPSPSAPTARSSRPHASGSAWRCSPTTPSPLTSKRGCWA